MMFIFLMFVFVTWHTAWAQPSFYAFESGHVRPLALSPDGSRLYAVNTPDNRLEIFAVSPDGLTPLETVPVGMEPVAVAFFPVSSSILVGLMDGARPVWQGKAIFESGARSLSSLGS